MFDTRTELLATSCSLDLHLSAFAAGRCAPTLLARTEMILLRRQVDRWRILVRHSCALVRGLAARIARGRLYDQAIQPLTRAKRLALRLLGGAVP
jgi:hypothetical protein